MTRTTLMAEFLSAMATSIPSSSRIVGCQFRGNPDTDGRWKVFPVTSIHNLDDDANIYLTVSAMMPGSDGEYRRRRDNFAAGCCLMIDDLGDGPGSKFPLHTIASATPTALIETSPGNHQAVYMFRTPIADPALMDTLIAGFIAKHFLGKDTGMAGINRVFRPPYGVNGKPKYNGWRVRCVDWRPECRYQAAELAEAFGIDLMPRGVVLPRNATVKLSDTVTEFVNVRQSLRTCGMLKSAPHPSGWQDIICPWTGDHTGGVNNGAAIREPVAENGWNGVFRCHHGSCADRSWRDLTEWLATQNETILGSINATPGPYNQWSAP